MWLGITNLKTLIPNTATKRFSLSFLVAIADLFSCYLADETKKLGVVGGARYWEKRMGCSKNSRSWINFLSWILTCVIFLLGLWMWSYFVFWFDRLKYTFSFASINPFGVFLTTQLVIKTKPRSERYIYLLSNQLPNSEKGSHPHFNCSILKESTDLIFWGVKIETP